MELPKDIRKLLFTYCTEPIYILNENFEIDKRHFAYPECARFIIKYMKLLEKYSPVKFDELMRGDIQKNPNPKIIKYFKSMGKKFFQYMHHWSLSANTCDDEWIGQILINYTEQSDNKSYTIKAYSEHCANRDWVLKYYNCQEYKNKYIVADLIQDPGFIEKLVKAYPNETRAGNIGTSISYYPQFFYWLNSNTEFITEEIIMNQHVEIACMLFNIFGGIKYNPTQYTVNVYNKLKEIIAEISGESFYILSNPIFRSISDIKNIDVTRISRCDREYIAQIYSEPMVQKILKRAKKYSRDYEDKYGRRLIEKVEKINNEKLNKPNA